MHTSRAIDLYTESEYNRYPVMTQIGSLDRSYLDSAYKTLEKAWQEYPWLLGIRCELCFPHGWVLPPEFYTNEKMEQFIASLKAQIVAHQSKLERRGSRVHPRTLRYIWAREYTRDGRPHYHVVLLLNHHAFFTLGTFEEGRDNLYNRINQAWASALGVPLSEVFGLVHFDTDTPVMAVGGYGDQNGFGELFYRTSYLCKYATKGYARWEHCFGTSRK